MHDETHAPPPRSRELPEILRESPVRVEFGAGAIAALGQFAREAGARHVLLVSDPGVTAAGHVDRAVALLGETGLGVTVFDGACENPTTREVALGLDRARGGPTDCVVGLGGGSAMDCAKGINLLLTGGGAIADYRGDPPAEELAKRRPLLPMILVPTTAGTGSEAQSFALIADADTHQKMACGDRRPPGRGGLRPLAAILDPDLTRTQPPAVAAAAGIDAVTHAVETAGTTRRNEASRAFSRQAWALLERALPRSVADPGDAETRAVMLLGAHLAGCAIETSMLGAAHACANPLTALYGTTHGVAVGLLLPHVIRFNAGAEPSATGDDGTHPYADLDPSADSLAARVEQLLAAARLPRRLRDVGVNQSALPELAELAAAQWTARFNPRAVDAAELLEVYRAAL